MTDTKESKAGLPVARSGKEELGSIDFGAILGADCPICLEPLKPPIWACAVALPEFHAHHMECAKNIHSGTGGFPTCSVCKSGGLGPSRFLDKQYESLFVNCPNKDCTVACLLSDIDTKLKAHQEICDKRPLPCLYSFAVASWQPSCTFMANNTDELFEHLIAKHESVAHRPSRVWESFHGMDLCRAQGIKPDEYVMQTSVLEAFDPDNSVLVLQMTECCPDDKRYKRELVAVTPSFSRRVPVCYIMAFNGKETQIEWNTTLNFQDLLHIKDQLDLYPKAAGFYLEDSTAPVHVHDDGRWHVFAKVITDPDATWILRKPDEITKLANDCAKKHAVWLVEKREKEKTKKEEEEKEEKKQKKEREIIDLRDGKDKAKGAKKDKLKETIDLLEKEEEEDEKKKTKPRVRKQPDRKSKRKRDSESSSSSSNGAGSGSASNGDETKKEHKKARIGVAEKDDAPQVQVEGKDNDREKWFKTLLPLDVIEVQPKDDGVWRYAMVAKVEARLGRSMVFIDAEGIDTVRMWSLDKATSDRQYARPIANPDRIRDMSIPDKQRLARTVKKMLDEAKRPLTIEYKNGHAVDRWHRARFTRVLNADSDPVVQVECDQHGLDHGAWGMTSLARGQIVAPAGRHTAEGKDNDREKWFKTLLPLDVIEVQPENDGVWRYAMVIKVNRSMVYIDTEGIDSLKQWSMISPTAGRRQYMRPIEPPDRIGDMIAPDKQRLARTVKKMLDEAKGPLPIDYINYHAGDRWHRARIIQVLHADSEHPTVQVECEQHGFDHGAWGMVYLARGNVIAPAGRHTRA